MSISEIAKSIMDNKNMGPLDAAYEVELQTTSMQMAISVMDEIHKQKPELAYNIMVHLYRMAHLN